MQKIILITAVLLAGMLTTKAQEKHALTLEFSGMKSDKGNLYVAVYANATDFLKKSVYHKVVPVKEGKATVVFTDITDGVYAVSSFHDENDNKKMDTRIFGIPKEPIGISNNAKGFMGPPKFEDAKFEISEDKTLKIQVN